MKRWIGLLVFAIVSFGVAHAAPPATVAATDVGFGNATVGASPIVMTTNLHSLDATSRTVGGFAKTGTGCNTDFSIATPTAFPFDVDMTGAMLTVTYTPTTAGNIDCTVTVNDNSATPVEIGNFHLTAKGLIARLQVVSAVTFTPAVRVNDLATAAHIATTNIALLNNGDVGSVLTISAVSSSDSQFTSAFSTPIVLNQGAPSVNLALAFNPNAAGTRTGNLTLTSNDPSTHTVAMTGTGNNAAIAAANKDLGTVRVGTAANGSVSISNTDTGILTVTGASFTTTADWITFQSGTGNSCTGTTACTFTTPLSITSTPGSVPFTCTVPSNAVINTTQTATVQFTSDADSGTNTANITCTAGKPVAMVSVTTLPFGNVPVPGSAPITVTVVNMGNLNLSVTNLASSDSHFTIGPCTGCASIAPTASASFTVTFTPNAVNTTDVAGSITFNTNDPNAATVTLPATGRGASGVIGVSPATLALGDVELTQTSAPLPVTISNTGNAPLTINSTTITGANAGDFAITTAGMTTIAVGSSSQWTIACTPSAQGSRTATFTVASSTYPTGNKTVSLTCNGTRGHLTPVTTTIDFGDTPVGTPVTRTFTLTNDGNLAVTGITGSTLPASVVVAGLPSMLAANGGSQVVTLTFTPAAAGPLNATYTITGNWGTHGQTTTSVITLNGNGQLVDYGFDPATIDVGSFRFDEQKATVTFRIENNGDAPITFPLPTYTPDAGQSPSDYSFTYKKNGAGANVTGNVTLNHGEFLLGTVKTGVLNRVGTVSGTLTLVTNLGTRTAMVTGTSTSAEIAVPATLDFGNVDVDDPAVHSMTFQIKNTGAGLLDLSSVTVAPGASSAFTVTFPATNQHLAQNGTADVTVTYHPTVDLPANQFDTITLIGHVGGVVDGTMLTMTTLKGHPIDRHFHILDIGSAVVAFRNPGTDAPSAQVTIENTGEAVLNISMVTDATCDPAIWTVGPETSATIPGNNGDQASNHSTKFHVKFSPTSDGQFSCVLDIVNDDNAMTVAHVTVNGIGQLRDVSLALTNMDIGYTGIGIPLVASQAIVIQNHDAMHEFHITRIDVPDSQFEIEAPPATIGAGGMLPLDITFTPTSVADTVTTTATIYLDSDDLATGMPVTITAHAVFVDAQGGGGCSTSGNGAGGGALLVAGAIAATLRKRKRAAIAGAAAVAALGGAAGADPVGPSLQVSTFAPTPATTGTGFQVQSADVGPDGALAVGVVTSYSTNLLVLAPSEGHAVEPLKTSLVFDVGAAYAFLDRFEVGAHMPFYRQGGDDAGNPMENFTTDPAGNARGNLTLDAKARLAAGGGFVGSVGVVGLVPTASEDQFLTTKPEVRGLLLGNYTLPVASNRISLAGNVGGVVRAEQDYANIHQKSGAVWAAAASVRVIDMLWVTGELYGEVIPGGLVDAMGGEKTLSPISGLAGLNFKPERRFTISAAAGAGINKQPGSPSFQGVLALAFVPGSAAIAPIHIPEPPKPDGDADGDGIPDSRDKCPNEPEDKDLFDDDDGCPDVDNDNDGVPDAQDKCPLDPEDKDGFQDDDGCPDLDNDGDGILDAQDKCPNEPEDKDGFQDVDGCPDPDNDGDGVPDAQDKCPTEPETINGITDDDGCPDKGDSVIVLSPDRIESLEPIQFTGTKLARGTEIVMKQIAGTLRAHVEIVRLRVTVHVQPSGDAEKDQQLSDKRAQAVRDWLVQWGIAPNRVEARGFGGTKPLVKPETRNAANINNRIELIILERK